MTLTRLLPVIYFHSFCFILFLSPCILYFISDLNLSDNQLQTSNRGGGSNVPPIQQSRSMPGSRRNSGRGIDAGPLIQEQFGNMVSSPPPMDMDNQQQQLRHNRFSDQRIHEMNQQNDQNLMSVPSTRTRHGSIMDLDTSGQNYNQMSGSIGGNANNLAAMDPNGFRNQRRASSSTLIQYNTNSYVT